MYRLFQRNFLFRIKQVILLYKRRCKLGLILFINIQVWFMQIKHLILEEACKASKRALYISSLTKQI
jgi:hypothetical protein